MNINNRFIKKFSSIVNAIVLHIANQFKGCKKFIVIIFHNDQNYNSLTYLKHTLVLIVYKNFFRLSNRKLCTLRQLISKWLMSKLSIYDVNRNKWCIQCSVSLVLLVFQSSDRSSVQISRVLSVSLLKIKTLLDFRFKG